eukprot:TRINITY_DN1284_c1_g3_i1.p1 TRINITY_DN1284_c1_g3~~TRINITY_DN1284_c1_g3_i1.p1  ORF type:complete len:102 (+),score=12.73 TRINITY_DN1284_c1_g3_i1:377-682(+)
MKATGSCLKHIVLSQSSSVNCNNVKSHPISYAFSLLASSLIHLLFLLWKHHVTSSLTSLSVAAYLYFSSFDELNSLQELQFEHASLHVFLDLPQFLHHCLA